MKSSTEVKDLATSLAMAQLELKAPPKDKTNPHFRNRYADLATIIATIAPTLGKHGLSVVQLVEPSPAGVTLETVLLHKSGQWISSTISMPTEKASAQGIGSALTYARRYALSAIVNVAADDDDDGNAASPTPPVKSNGKKAEQTSVVDPVEQKAALLIEACEAGFKTMEDKLEWKSKHREEINHMPQAFKQQIVDAFEKSQVRS